MTHVSTTTAAVGTQLSRVKNLRQFRTVEGWRLAG
jgi:hypothetical protein